MPEILSPEVKPPAAKTADDINDLFKTLDDETPPKEPKPKEKEKEEPEVKDDDDDLELKDPDEEIEKLDLAKPDENIDLENKVAPRKKEILKKYPEVFKDFPFLESMMYRDRQWNEIFGSFDDAKEVAERADTFNQFENQLLSGNTEEVLKNVKDVDEKAFNIIVDEYLPTLAKVDKDAYFHVVGNLNRRLIMEMVAEANDTGNDDLKQAALLVNQFVFGSSKFTAPTTRVQKTDNTERSEVEKERLSFVQERFETSRDDLQAQVDNTLRATITDYIDPKNVMSSYVKKNAVADAMKILANAIANEDGVPKNLDRLWRAAFDSKFSKDSLGKIKSFYLSKAKGNLKNAILKARAEALKDVRPPGRDKETDDETDAEETQRQTRRITPGRPSQPKKNEMKKGESVADFFARD